MNLSVGVWIGREIPLAFRLVVATKTVNNNGGGSVKRRRAALKLVDRQLAKGNLKLAVSLVKQLSSSAATGGGRLRGFSSAKLVPRGISLVEDLHLSVAEKSALQPLFDSVLDSIKRSLQSSALEESSVTGEENDLYLEDDIVDHKQVLQHEAGHFLVGYLLGVLPKQYRLSIFEDVKQDNSVDASVKFVGFEFLTEIEDDVLSKKNLHKFRPGHRANRSKLSYTVLSKFACVIVGGLVAEHLDYGYSKGHHADVEKLDRVLKWLQFTEDEANTLMRWAVLNTLLILGRHGEARSAIVEAMAHGKSIGNCIEIIETTLNHLDF